LDLIVVDGVRKTFYPVINQSLFFIPLSSVTLFWTECLDLLGKTGYLRRCGYRLVKIVDMLTSSVTTDELLLDVLRLVNLKDLKGFFTSSGYLIGKDYGLDYLHLRSLVHNGQKLFESGLS